MSPRYHRERLRIVGVSSGGCATAFSPEVDARARGTGSEPMLQTARSLRIRLFGRPHLTEDAEPIKFKAPARALSLLAYLLVNGSRPLTRDAVAFALWPDDMEADARANLRRHLFYLTNDVLPAPPPKTPWILADKRTIGWNAAAPAWCDVREFERLGADAAVDAVALYSGELLEGFEDEWIEAPRERLRDAQIRLLLGLVNTSRASSMHEAGIGYARRLLAIDPWREDGIRALIELRHATGDRAGALATYREFVKRLEAEMGVAPMAETTAVYERVANAKEWPPGSGSGASAPSVVMDRAQAASTPAEDGEPLETGFVPSPFWQAPQSIANAQALRPVPSFTGRERELGQLDAALWEQTGQVAITGLGGIGKSALAREYARRNRDRYAAVWSLDAETEAGIIDGLVRLGSEFVPSLAKAEDRRNAAEHAVANVLSGLTKPVLLIFDNLDDERLLRAWSPRGAAHTLVTSRHAMPGGDLVVVRLDALAADEAVQYLQREAGRADLTAADALLITQALGYLPLALAHAAAYLKGTVNVTAQRYLDRISEHLARTPRGADYDRAVYATFREAIARAESDGPGAAALLALAACYAPDALPEELFDRNATVYPPLRPLIPEASEPPRDLHAAAADPIGREEALGALHRFSLLIFSPESRTYTMHRLVQQAARTLSAADESRWRECAVTTADAGFPTIDFAHWTGCERLLAHARAALEGLPGVTCNPPAARLALRCGQYLRKRAAYADAEALLRRGVALAERCDAGGLDGDLAAQLEALAALLRDTNRLVEAEPLARRSVELCEAEAGRNPARLAAALNELAILLHYSNQLVEAEALYRRALKIDEAALGEDHPRIALRLHNLALVLHETNRLEDAQRLLTRALSIDERAHGTEHPDVASDASSLGWLVLQTGRLREAEPMLRRALTIREAAYGKHHPVFAHALGDVAVLLHDAERFDEAEALYRQALRVYETSYGARHPVVAACLNNIAELLADQGRIEEAEALYRRALAGDEATYGSEHVNVARDLNNFAGLLALRGDVAGAQTQLRRALAIFESNYDAGHPRVLAARDNAERLRRHAEGTPNAAGWRYVRRSPSRGLR